MLKALISGFEKQLAESEASNRSFGLLTGVVFLVVGGIRLLRGGDVRWWAVGLGVALLLVTAVAPSILRGPKRIWLLLGFLLGAIVNPIVLAILFFVIITPVAAVMRVFGHDPLRLKPAPDAKSHWQDHPDSEADMRMQY